MKKYEYGKFSPDNVPFIETNEFHTLSMFLGAYLDYSSDLNKYIDFADYVNQNNLVFNQNNEEYYWKYINKAHIFIRNCLLSEAPWGSSKYVSRRQIRKLGYSGVGTVRMYPLSAPRIQSVMFKWVFEETILTDVKEQFLKYISAKWGYPVTIDNKQDSIPISIDEAIVDRIFRSFIAFQYELLITKNDGDQLLNELKSNNTYRKFNAK